MSHAKLRKENNCLNCDAVVDGPYCRNCGQLNAEPKQTLGHLLLHFIEDVTHFDGKFFSTMKYLLIKPGFLSSEYIKGRRTKYLDPVRMYLFISALFFLFYNTVQPFHVETITVQDRVAMKYIDSLRVTMKDQGLGFYLDNIPGTDKQATVYLLNDELQHGSAHYDSLQRTLPRTQRDGIFDRYFKQREAASYENYLQDPYNFVPNTFNLFFHSLSKVFFISLPLFALILYLLYIRRKTDKYYYVSHAIFALHYYTISFVFLFVALLNIHILNNYSFESNTAFYLVSLVIITSLYVYLYIAMLRFYRQGWFKTLVKFLLLSVSSFVLIICITIFLFLNSFMTLI